MATKENDGCVYIEQQDMARMALPSVKDPSMVKRGLADIQYGKLECQKLDIYYPPEGHGPFPVLFYVHGGGWTMGNKREGALDCIIDAINSGYVIISVDYRLAPECVFPEFIFDVKTAVRWARANAAQYELDPFRFGMLGDSAGGHITLMMAFTANRPEYEGEKYGWAGYSSELRAVCDMYGPSDLAADDGEFYRESQVPRMIWGEGGDAYAVPFGTKERPLRELISPISLVHKDIPPVLIQQGGMDAIVAYQHSTLLAERIKKICGEDRVDLRLYPERNHSDKAFMTDENCAEVVKFFDKYLK